jgi:hypothetical protein
LSLETPPATVGRTLSLVASIGTPAVAAGQRLDESDLSDSPSASIAQYLDSGKRVEALTDFVWKIGIGLVVLVVLAWAVGALPGAVKLF